MRLAEIGDVRDLGLPLEVANTPLTLVKAGNGSLHFPTCRQVVTIPSPETLDVVLGVLPLVEMGCPSCEGVGPLSPPLLQQVAYLRRVAALPEEVPQEPLALRKELRETSRLFKEARLPGLSTSQWHDAAEDARRRLSSWYAALKERMRSPEVRDELLQWARMGLSVEEPLPWVVFGIRAYRPHQALSEVADALVASFWEGMPVLGSFVVVAPQEVHMYLEATTHAWVGELTPACPVLPTDTKATWENLAALWAAEEESGLTDLLEALDAARRV